MEILLIIIIAILGILLYFFRDKNSISIQQEEKVLPFRKKDFLLNIPERRLNSISIQQEEKVLPFRKKDFLLNIPERRFFEGLQQIIPAGYIVFPQIVLSNIVQVTSKKKEFWTYQNKINRKTIDFVIFEKQYIKPVIAIEYDGKTHDRSDRQERDDFVNMVLESAGIKSLRIRHQENINFEEVKNKINELLT